MKKVCLVNANRAPFNAFPIVVKKLEESNCTPLTNTMKNECTNLYEFRTEDDLYQTIEEFAYATYNHVRRHSYNDYRTPYQARMAAFR